MVTLSEIRSIAGAIAGRVVEKKLRPVWARLRGVVRHGTLNTIDTSTGFQTVDAGTLAGDEDRGVSYFENFGFRSVPPPGSEGLVFRIGGDRSNSVAICFGNRSVTLSTVDTGETAIYALSGAQIILRDSGNIEVTPGPGGVVQLGGPSALLAVARETDPTILNSDTLTWMAQVHAYLAALHLLPFIGPVFSALVPPVLPPTSVPTGEGTITSGGNASTSL